MTKDKGSLILFQSAFSAAVGIALISIAIAYGGSIDAIEVQVEILETSLLTLAAVSTDDKIVNDTMSRYNEVIHITDGIEVIKLMVWVAHFAGIGFLALSVITARHYVTSSRKSE